MSLRQRLGKYLAIEQMSLFAHDALLQEAHTMHVLRLIIMHGGILGFYRQLLFVGSALQQFAVLEKSQNLLTVGRQEDKVT